MSKHNSCFEFVTDQTCTIHHWKYRRASNDFPINRTPLLLLEEEHSPSRKYKLPDGIVNSLKYEDWILHKVNESFAFQLGIKPRFLDEVEIHVCLNEKTDYWSRNYFQFDPYVARGWVTKTDFAFGISPDQLLSVHAERSGSIIEPFPLSTDSNYIDWGYHQSINTENQSPKSNFEVQLTLNL